MKIVAALLVVVLLGVAITLVSLSALATQRPQSMPFGVTGSSPVVTAAESEDFAGYQVSFVNTLFANKSDVMNAINQGTIYGAYIPGTASDTLILVPSKSFFGSFAITAVFESAAKKAGHPLTVQVVKPLPKGMDPFGAVTGLLLLPLIIGGLLAAILVFKSTGTAVQRWRGLLLIIYSIAGAVLTLVIAGPLVGAFAGNRFWPLLPWAVLIEVTVAVVTAALLVLLPALLAMMGALLLFVVVGLVTAGQAGTAMMPTYWQAIGGALPPRYGANLIQNVLYFSSNNITGSVVVLVVYALIAGAVLGYTEWLRPRRRGTRAVRAGAPQPDGPRRRAVTRVVLIALVLAAVDQSLFAVNYMSSGHNPVSRNMPFAVVGTSTLTSAPQLKGTLELTSYPSQAAAENAIDRAKAWGALVPGPSGSNTLLVASTISDISPLTLAEAFESAAKSQGQTITVKPYAPKPLAPGDPYGLVLSMLLTPLLLCGYMASTMLRAVTGAAAERFRGLIIVGYAIFLALVIDLIATFWFNGVPSDKFWILWAIMALIVSVVGLLAAVLQRLLGAAGTLVTVLIVILFGKPSSGGANGVPYLPAFWSDIGPVFPPRNAYILLRNAVYFGAHGTTQPLIILFVYLVGLGAVLGVLDWRRHCTPQLSMSSETEAEVAVSGVPAGVAI